MTIGFFFHFNSSITNSNWNGLAQCFVILSFYCLLLCAVIFFLFLFCFTLFQFQLKVDRFYCWWLGHENFIELYQISMLNVVRRLTERSKTKWCCKYKYKFSGVHRIYTRSFFLFLYIISSQIYITNKEKPIT